MWPFQKKQPAVAPRLHLVEARSAPINIKRATSGALRPGMWVVVSERVGVLKTLNEFGVCAVMLTDGEGFNVVELQVPIAEIRQAKRSEIPQPRVSHLSAEQLERMGY